jgi:hypothetical protein
MDNIPANAVRDNGELGLHGIFNSSNIFICIQVEEDHTEKNYVQISKTVTKIDHQKFSVSAVAPNQVFYE